MADDGNGNGHDREDVALKRLEHLAPHPYLLERGFPPRAIQEAGWRVEKLGDRHVKYGLRDHPEAAEAEVWFLPYRHWNGQLWFERIRLIHDEDLERFGGGKYRQPAGMKLWLYDPYLAVADVNVEPLDSVLLIEGEANTVAARSMLPEMPVVGLPGQRALTARMAARLSHIPVVFLWLDRHDPGAEENAQRIAGLLAKEGCEDVRQLPIPPGLADANDLLRGGAESGGRVLRDMLAGAEAVDLTPGQGTAKTTLEALWGLGAASIRIESVRVTGYGREAACEIDLSNGAKMTFERMLEIASGMALTAELAACAQVNAPLKQTDRITSIALLTKLADHIEAETANSVARGWGSEFLFACQQIEVDMTDQAQRWAMFEHLRTVDPWALARDQPGTNPAAHTIVPVDASGMRYVRTGWFLSVVRQLDGSAGLAQIVSRMLRVGWQRRGHEGRIGARRPGLPGQMNLKFLLVPAEWENIPDEGGNRGYPLNARESDLPRARDNYSTNGYQDRVPAVTEAGGAPDGPGGRFDGPDSAEEQW